MKAPVDFDAALNPEQRAAALAPDGPVLVIAAAGTGKTRTLTYRVAHLVERGIDPNRLLLLTFTNRAAREMLDRARALVGEAVGGVWGGTFHHLGNRILRRYAQRAGYRSDYAILDQDDAERLMRACVADLKLNEAHFPKPDVVLSVLSLARNREEPLRRTAENRFAGLVDPDALDRAATEYARRKQALNAMDFDDLLVHALRLLQEHTGVCERYQEQFLHILVDEYQDTNPLQAHLVDALAARHRNLLVVGDDFQSIYAWRGADFRNFLTFPKRYADAAVFKLETNYRSVPGILDVANACIAGNPEQFQKTLRAVRQDARRPVLVELRDGLQQARFVIQRIQELRRRGTALRDIAVLYRAHFHAMELQLELARENVPYVITSGVRFFEQAHVKDALAFLRGVQNPGDELAFQRFLSLFPRTGERTAQKIWRSFGGRVCLREEGERKRLGAALPSGAQADWARLEPVFTAGPDGVLPSPTGLVDGFVDRFYSRYAAENFDDFERRLEDIAEMAGFMGRFATVDDFLNEVALLTNVDTQPDRMGEKADQVLLSTVHQAKGLEWRAVFLLWMAEGLFPSGRSLSDEHGGGLAEERRLFYVATTRAKDELFLCVPQLRRSHDGGMQFYSPSRFIREVPGHLLERERARYYD